MKRSFLFLAVAFATMLITSCGNNKSEKDIEAAIAAKYQHKIDSMKLAEAEAKLAAVEQKNSKPAVSKESVAPAQKRHTSFSSEFSWLSSRRVTYDDLQGLSGSELRILRNAIYAMHGRKFKSADLRAYFSQFDWYQPLYEEVSLTRLEAQNVETIKSWE